MAIILKLTTKDNLKVIISEKKTIKKAAIWQLCFQKECAINFIFLYSEKYVSSRHFRFPQLFRIAVLLQGRKELCCR